MSLDERWVTRSPEQMAGEAIASFRERFEQVLEDLTALGADRVSRTASGSFLLVTPVIADPRQAMYFLPTPAFREWAVAQRDWVTIEGKSSLADITANVERQLAPLLD